MYPKELKVESVRDTCTPVFIAGLFTVAKMWKQRKYPSTDEWRSKMWFIHTLEYYSFLKRNKMDATSWMKLEGKYCMIPII